MKSPPVAQQWQELAAAIRRHLTARALTLADMTVEEVASFVRAVTEAWELEIDAACFEAQLEAHRARLARETAYGG